MLDSIRRLDSFVERRSGRTVWGVGWGIFLTAAAFVAHTILATSEQNALVGQDRATANRYAQVVAKLDAVPRMLELVVDANLGAATYFRSEIEARQDVGAIPVSIVDEAQRRVAETRNGIDALISVLDSLQVGDPNADSMIAKFRDDLAAMDQVLVPREHVLIAVRAGEAGRAQSLLKDVRSDPGGRLARQLNAFALRTTAFAQMAETQKLEYEADLEARRVRRRNYQLQIYALAPSAAYMALFMTISLRAWRRDRSAEVSGAESDEGDHHAPP